RGADAEGGTQFRRPRPHRRPGPGRRAPRARRLVPEVPSGADEPGVARLVGVRLGRGMGRSSRTADIETETAARLRTKGTDMSHAEEILADFSEARWDDEPVLQDEEPVPQERPAAEPQDG